jgi:hypothetical protein
MPLIAVKHPTTQQSISNALDSWITPNNPTITRFDGYVSPTLGRSVPTVHYYMESLYLHYTTSGKRIGIITAMNQNNLRCNCSRELLTGRGRRKATALLTTTCFPTSSSSLPASLTPSLPRSLPAPSLPRFLTLPRSLPLPPYFRLFLLSSLPPSLSELLTGRGRREAAALHSPRIIRVIKVN